MGFFKGIFCIIFMSGTVFAAQYEIFERSSEKKKIYHKKELLIGLLNATRTVPDKKIPVNRLAAYIKIAQVLTSNEKYNKIVRNTNIFKDGIGLPAEDFAIQFCHPFIAHEIVSTNKVVGGYIKKRPIVVLIKNLRVAKERARKIIPFVREMVFAFMASYEKSKISSKNEKRFIGIVSLEKIGFPGLHLQVRGLFNAMPRAEILLEIIDDFSLDVAHADISLSIGIQPNFLHIDMLKTSIKSRQQGCGSSLIELVKGLARGLSGDTVIKLYPKPFSFGAPDEFEAQEVFDDMKKKLIVFYRIHGFMPNDNMCYKNADLECRINKQQGI